MKTIRIGGGAGYGGDRIEPALDLITDGGLDYIIFECLAERTIALAQKERLEHPEKGYNPLLEYRMERILPLLDRHPVKIITNMGAANPVAAAKRIAAMAAGCGLRLKVAAVTGDDIYHRLDAWGSAAIMETGEPLSGLGDSVISANAYLGAGQITLALDRGADIVVTGRVADPALVTGPLMHEFGRAWDDWDFLGKTICAGHLLECGGQVTGGYFADPGKKEAPRLWDLGFPILTFDEGGGITLEKLPRAGGLVSAATVTEQLLYEIQDPAFYLTPDVVADFSGVSVAEAGENRVTVTGATGRQRPDTLKVSVGYEDGWIGEGEISYGGQNARARAILAGEVVQKRLAKTGHASRGLRIDLMGVDSLYRTDCSRGDPGEVRLRVAAHTDTRAGAEVIGREVEALYTNGPAGGGGARQSVRKVVSIASILIPAELTAPQLVWMEDKQ